MKRKEAPGLQNGGGPPKRGTGQAVLVLLAVALICLPGSLLIPYTRIGSLGVLVNDAYRIKSAMRSVGIICGTIGIVWWVQLLRCPYCKKGFLMPWWKAEEHHACGSCGRQIAFEDDRPASKS